MTGGRPREAGRLEERFWASCAAEAMELQRCRRCGAWRYPPARRCPECWEGAWAWERPAGRGRLVSHVTFRRAYDRLHAERLPYTVAVVELEEGPRLLTRLAGFDPSTGGIGRPVTLAYEPGVDGRTLPVFVVDHEDGH